MSNEFNIKQFLAESSTITENPILTIAAGAAGAMIGNALSGDNEVEEQATLSPPVLGKGSHCVVKDHVKKYGGATGKVICPMGDNYLVKIAGRRAAEVEFLEDELTASMDENFSGAFASAPVAEGSAEETMVCKDCGDEMHKPTSDCKHDCDDESGSWWMPKSESSYNEEYNDYMKVHGTSQTESDLAEAVAIDEVYSDDDEEFKGKGEEDLGDMGIDTTIMPGDSVSVSKELGNEATVIAQRAGYIVVKLPAGGMKLLKDGEWWVDDAKDMESNEYADIDYDDSEPEELQFEAKKKGDNTYSVHDGKNVIKTGITRAAAIKMAKEKGLEYGSAAHVQDKLNETTSVTDYNPKSPDGTRTEILAKIRKADKAGDANEVSRLKTAAQQAGATQKEMASEGRFGNDEGQPHMKHINRKREMDQELKGELGHREPTDAEMDAAAERNKKNPPFAKNTNETDDNESDSYTAGYNDGKGNDDQAPEFKTHWGPGGDDYQRGYADAAKDHADLRRNAGLNEIETATDKLDKDRAPGESTTPTAPTTPTTPMTDSAATQLATKNTITDMVANDKDTQDAIKLAINPEGDKETKLDDRQLASLQKLAGLIA